MSLRTLVALLALAVGASASASFDPTQPGRFAVGVAPALATGPRGTTAARHGERGANTPDRR